MSAPADLPDHLLPVTEAIRRKAGGENFPVAPRVLPARIRRHLQAVYGYARLVDDVGDEPAGDGGDRLALLDAVAADLDRVYAGTPRLPVLAELARTVAACAIPPDPLRRLLEANRRDQIVPRYQTYAQLLDYCTLSANPVGELVLHVFGRATPERIALSDRICTALQLTEHWQDVAEDLRRGRRYLPDEDLARFEVSEHQLAAPRSAPQVRRLIAFEVDRARRLLDAGSPLVGELSGYARLAVAGYAAGGYAALDAIVDRDHEVLAGPPRPRRSRLVRHACGLAWRGRR